MFQNKILPYLLSAISGAIFVLAWQLPTSSFFVLFSLVPLLFAENIISKQTKSLFKAFCLGFLCFFTANIVGISWLSKQLSYWALLFFIYNAAIWGIVFCFFSWFKKKVPTTIAYVGFVTFFVLYEFIYLRIPFSFPAILAGAIVCGENSWKLLQWYEYTGILGGSLWVYTANALLFLLLRKLISEKKLSVGLAVASILIVALPIFLSYYIYESYKEKGKSVEVVIVQPNYNPYTQKFSIPNSIQFKEMLKMAEKEVTANTQYIVFPETALDSNIWKNNITEHYYTLEIQKLLRKKAPNASLVSGINMMEYYIVPTGAHEPTPTAKKASENIYVDYFNAAAMYSLSDVQTYKKSKLVLGTEYVPFSNKYEICSKISMKLGGSAQSRGTQERPTVFDKNNEYTASLICYESLFGDYARKFANIGASAFFIITNDGWWNKTAGYIQHARFSQIRAVEMRRSVARCGNTGISAIINQRGDIEKQSSWWKKETIKGTLRLNTHKTFYTKHGDFLGYGAIILSFILLLFPFFIKKKRA